MSSYRSALTAILVACWLRRHSPAEPDSSIRGRASDCQLERSATELSVTIQGTRFGTMTRTDGTFDLVGIPVGTAQLSARGLGCASSLVVTVARPPLHAE